MRVAGRRRARYGNYPKIRVRAFSLQDARNVASPHRSHAVRSVVACDQIVCTRAAGCVAVWRVAAANTSTDAEDESIV
jgi:hypothetical protein